MIRSCKIGDVWFWRIKGYKEFGRLPGGSIKDGKYWDVVYLCKNL